MKAVSVVPGKKVVSAVDAAKAVRVLRGGGWNNHAQNARSAYRNHNQPDRQNDNTGFRLALSSNWQWWMPAS
jgi:formylglycine-generating enzyme required for sulfatase activity